MNDLLIVKMLTSILSVVSIVDLTTLHKVWPNHWASTSVTIKLAFWQVCAVCLSSQQEVQAVHELHAHLLLPLPADPQGKLALRVALQPLHGHMAALGCVLFVACLSEQWLLQSMRRLVRSNPISEWHRI